MGATWRKGLLEWFDVIQGAGGHNFKGQFLSRSASASSRYHKSSERLQGHWANLYYLLATKDPKQARVIWSLSSLYNRMGETTAAFPAWIFFFWKLLVLAALLALRYHCSVDRGVWPDIVLFVSLDIMAFYTYVFHYGFNAQFTRFNQLFLYNIV